MVVLNIFHVLIAIAMVALVLVQRGAGATAGAAFGSGASGTVFGARGAGTFLTKSTWVLAALFCAISLAMAVMVSRLDTTPETDLGVVSTTPAADAKTVETPDTQAMETSTGDEPVDLPTLGLPEGAAGNDSAPQDQAAEDLPALDGETTESTESSPGESSDADANPDDS